MISIYWGRFIRNLWTIFKKDFTYSSGVWYIKYEEGFYGDQ